LATELAARPHSGPPVGGRPVKFGEVARNVDVQERDPLSKGIDRYVGLDHLEPGNLHIRSWGNVADGTTFTRRFKPGQVLFGKRRPYQRKAAVAEFDGICSGDILVFEPANGDLIPELLPFIVESDGFFEHALRTSAGSLSPRTRWRDLADYTFLLPPFEEQRSIADILWAADAVVERWREVVAQMQAMVNVVVEDFLGQAGTVGWPSAATSTLLTEPPRNGLSPKTNASARGFPTLSIGAVRDGVILAEGNVKYADMPAAEVATFQLQPGDVLVVRGNGNKALVGRCGLVGQIPDDCFYPDLLIRLKFDERKMLPRFAVLCWNAPSVHARLQTTAKSTNGIWKVNGKDVSSHRLFVPPLEEQAGLLRLVEGMSETRTLADWHLQALLTVKTNLLGSLLSGPES
jgi:type I restriction enzyme, S subunit